MKKVSIRSIFVASKGKLLVSVDLSQAESWIVAYASGDQNMIWSLNNSDIHTDSGAALFASDKYCTHNWTKLPNETRKCKQCGYELEKTGRYIGKRYNHA